MNESTYRERKRRVLMHCHYGEENFCDGSINLSQVKPGTGIKRGRCRYFRKGRCCKKGIADCK